MGKKLELKRIPNPSNRHSSFSKRKNGLLKKSFELSVLCDAEVALIIFSDTGKIYEFASNNNMSTILGKYRMFQEATETSGPTLLQNVKFDQSRHQKLRERLNILEIKGKNLAGEELELLTMRELQGLEKNLQIGVKRIRHLKRGIHSQSSKLLEQKVICMAEENKKLESKLGIRGNSFASALENASVHQTNLHLGEPSWARGDGKTDISNF